MDACDVPIHDRASKLCKRHHYFLKKWGDPDPISREIRIRKTRSITKQGYVVLRMPEHPNAHPKNKRVFEHVVAMSEMIGRPLRKGESVHHKNNIKDDNRTENLELWVTHQPSGARVEDLVEWARNFISSYGKDAA